MHKTLGLTALLLSLSLALADNAFAAHPSAPEEPGGPADTAVPAGPDAGASGAPGVMLPTRPTAPTGFGPDAHTPPDEMQGDRAAARNAAIDSALDVIILDEPIAPDAAGAPTSIDLMLRICQTVGGGVRSNPDGTAHCVGPDGKDLLDPVPIPTDD